MRRLITVLIIFAGLSILFIRFDFLPEIGNPESAPNTHTTEYYIEHATTVTNAPNMVTSIIVDFRGFDTMYETTVMFLAGVGVVMILANHPDRRKRVRTEKHAKERKYRVGDPVYRTINKQVMIAIINPLIMIYAFYVLFHGEVSLGGGFQAGALLGMTYILDTMVVTERRNAVSLPKQRSVALGGIGTFIYVLTGILCMTGGGIFLEYEKLPFHMAALEKHSTGMLMVEIGVAICVMSTIITILNAILERARFDDDRN